MAKNNSTVSTLIWSGVAFAVGILFCFSMSIGISGLSNLIGILIIVAGAVIAFSTCSKKKSLLSMNGLLSAVVISFGIIFMVKKLAGIVIDFIPWTLVVLGAFILIDALLLRFARNDSSTIKLVAQIVLGVITLTLGLLVKFIDGWYAYSATILGVFLIVYALINVFYTITNK